MEALNKYKRFKVNSKKEIKVTNITKKEYDAGNEIIVIVSAGFLHPLLLEFWLLLQVYHWHFHVHMLSL